MTRWMSLAVLLVALGGTASLAFADMDAPRSTLPARGTEGPDVSAKAEPQYLRASTSSTYVSGDRGVEGPETR